MRRLEMTHQQGQQVGWTGFWGVGSGCLGLRPGPFAVEEPVEQTGNQSRQGHADQNDLGGGLPHLVQAQGQPFLMNSPGLQGGRPFHGVRMACVRKSICGQQQGQGQRVSGRQALGTEGEGAGIGLGEHKGGQAGGMVPGLAEVTAGCAADVDCCLVNQAGGLQGVKKMAFKSCGIDMLQDRMVQAVVQHQRALHAGLQGQSQVELLFLT